MGADGKIARICLGNFITECNGSITIYTNTFNASAGKKSNFTGEKETKYGNPEKPDAGEYFKDGWWTDPDDNRITKAHVGDKVKFHIQTKNIEKGKKISFRLFDNDSLHWNDDELTFENSDQKLEVDKDGKACLQWTLGKRAAELIKRESWDYCIELYMKCSYEDETVELANSETTWLNVTLPPKKEKIIFVQASSEHILPEMYDSKTGDIMYIAKANLQYGKKIHGLYSSVANAGGELSIFRPERWAYEIGVRRLQKGTMVMTTGNITTTRRLFERSISNIDETFKREIVMGVNFGGTKQINQLEAVTAYGLPKYLKMVGKVLTVIGGLMGMAGIVNAHANGELPSIPYMPPFIEMEIDKLDEELNEIMKVEFYNQMRKAIESGMEPTRRFFRSKKISEEYRMGYQFIELSEEALEAIIKGEIMEIIPAKPHQVRGTPIHDIASLSFISGNNSGDCGMIIQTLPGENDKYDRTTKIHKVHVLFLPELIKNKNE